ncbi:MAG: thiamine pyrophosphate-binding protein, partial [Hyphomicrobiales bacterium]
MATVRDASFDVFRRLGMTTIFSNPGSTEVSLLTDLPDDLDFVLGLHEASVVGIATGHALASERAALVILHTTAGLGNAVGALATARVNRAPLVVIVGQQDRRHLESPWIEWRLRFRPPRGLRQPGDAVHDSGSRTRSARDNRS